ncbi:hypothetical protein MASR2M36_25270 [Providencia sp.]
MEVNKGGNITVDLPESLTGKLLAITNTNHNNTLSNAAIVPSDGIWFIVQGSGDHYIHATMSNGGKDLMFKK